MKTPTPEKTPNVMEALDAGLAVAATHHHQPCKGENCGTTTANHSAECIAEHERITAMPSPEAEAMPAGSEQLDSQDGVNTPAHWRFRRMAYSMTLLGLILLPVMLLIRTGRWSMRNLAAHDRGWEFGPW